MAKHDGILQRRIFDEKINENLKKLPNFGFHRRLFWLTTVVLLCHLLFQPTTLFYALGTSEHLAEDEFSIHGDTTGIYDDNLPNDDDHANCVREGICEERVKEKKTYQIHDDEYQNNELFNVTEKNFQRLFHPKSDDGPIGSRRRLLLLVLHDSSHPNDKDILDSLREASRLIRDQFRVLRKENEFIKEKNIIPPVISVMDLDGVSSQWLEKYKSTIGSIDCPSFSFILSDDQTEMEFRNKIKADRLQGKNNSDVFNGVMGYSHYLYLGKHSTAKDVYETVLHRWYRLVVTKELSDFQNLDAELSIRMNERLEYCDDLKIFDESQDDTCKSEDAKMTSSTFSFPSEPIFTFRSMQSVKEFMEFHGPHVLHHVEQDLSSEIDHEEEYAKFVMDFDSHLNMSSDYNHTNHSNGSSKVNEPFHVFVQCRITKESLDNADDGVFSTFSASYDKFQELSRIYLARGDVIFIVVLSDNGCDWIDAYDSRQEIVMTREKNNYDGGVLHLSLYPQIYDNDSQKSHAAPNLSSSNLLNLENMEKNSRIHLPCLNSQDCNDLVHFVSKHSTPPIMWYDKLTSVPLAFPIYRTTHVLLFIDAHTVGIHNNMVDKSNRLKYFSKDLSHAAEIAMNRSRSAIRTLRRASLHLKDKYPFEDVVFLVVPSTEIRMMKVLGIDIWTDSDIACFQTNDKRMGRYHNSIGRCHADIGSLPKLLVVRRTQHIEGHDSNVAFRQYYLELGDLLNGKKGNTSTFETIDTFLSGVLNGDVEPQIRSEDFSSSNSFQADPNENKDLTDVKVNDSGVQTITGKSFWSAVIEKSHVHSIVKFYAPTCGHCKRFSTVWNEVGEIVQTLNWGNLIEVLKMDLTQNEVSYDGVDVTSFPTVYYFPAGAKDNPIQLTLDDLDGMMTDNKSSEHFVEKEMNLGSLRNATYVMEWMISKDKFDIAELLRLADSDNERNT